MWSRFGEFVTEDKFISTGRGVYRPRVLDRSTDADLEALLGQLDRHIASIPDEFAFTGNDTNQRGGLLNLMIVCVEVSSEVDL